MAELNSQGQTIYLQGARAMLRVLYQNGFLNFDPRQMKPIKSNGTRKQKDDLFFKAYMDKVLTSHEALEYFMGEDFEAFKPKYTTDEKGILHCEITTPWERAKEKT